MDRDRKPAGVQRRRREVEIEETGGVRLQTGIGYEPRGHPGPAYPRKTWSAGAGQTAPVRLAITIGASHDLLFEGARSGDQLILRTGLRGRERRHTGTACRQRSVR